MYIFVMYEFTGGRTHIQLENQEGILKEGYS